MHCATCPHLVSRTTPSEPEQWKVLTSTLRNRVIAGPHENLVDDELKIDLMKQWCRSCTRLITRHVSYLQFGCFVDVPPSLRRAFCTKDLSYSASRPMIDFGKIPIAVSPANVGVNISVRMWVGFVSCCRIELR